jgi:hypothetical protein
MSCIVIPLKVGDVNRAEELIQQLLSCAAGSLPAALLVSPPHSDLDPRARLFILWISSIDVEHCFLHRPSSSTAIEVATHVGTNTDPRNGKSDSRGVLSRQHIDLGHQPPVGGSSPGNRHEHAGGRSPHGANLHTARGGPSWRRSESAKRRTSIEGVSISWRSRTLASGTCEAIRQGALII